MRRSPSRRRRAAASTLGVFVGGCEYLVVRDGRLEFEEELFVLWIVDRAVEIRTGEASDRFERVPKGNEQEVRPVALRPAEDGHAAVPRGLAVFLEPALLQVRKIRIRLRRLGHAVPRPGNHSSPPTRQAAEPDEFAASGGRSALTESGRPLVPPLA